jgi:zinc protease
MLPGLMMAGTLKHNRQALREELDRLGITISSGAGGGGRGRRGGGGAPALGQLTFSVEAKRSTLPEAIKLLGEILREPAFPEAEFDRMKRASLAGSESARTDPAALASNRLARALAPYPAEDIRYVPTLEEGARRVGAVTLEQVKALYRNQVGGEVAQVALVGDFDEEPTLAGLRAALQGWKSPTPVKRIGRSAPADLVGARETILTPDRANAVFLAGLVFPLKEADPDYSALRLGNFILGGGTLSSRLGNRIRQKEGLSYGVTSSFSASSLDPSASFTVNAIVNPGNIDRLEKAFFEELKEFLSSGPSSAELADARKAFLEAQKVGRTGDGALAGQVVTNLYLGRTFAHVAEQERRIAALTAEDVKSAFQKYIDPKKLVVVRAGDFKK